LIGGSILLVIGLTVSGFAADFPKKPITIVVNQPAGDGVDLTTRVFAQSLQEQFKVPIIVQNITEGGGMKGVQMVFEAKPDGYTLLANLGTRNIQGELVYRAPYKILEFTSIIGLTKVSMGVAARKEAPFNTLSELKALSQKKPISAGTSGVGSLAHFLFLRLKEEGGISMEAIPFRGHSPSATALMGGHIDISVISCSYAVIDLDRLKLICTFGRERSEFFPNFPTALEQGYNITVEDTTGILAPPKLPKEIATFLETAFAKAISTPEVKEKLKRLGRILSKSSGEAYHKELMETYSSVDKYKAVFKLE
jgi:tripartite-type tricarboxylate transporter receptor subunit TctC